ncbi:Imidazoleglycerol-phosphate dehydratase [Bienertia sinuspersici]
MYPLPSSVTWACNSSEGIMMVGHGFSPLDRAMSWLSSGPSYPSWEWPMWDGRRPVPHGP